MELEDDLTSPKLIKQIKSVIDLKILTEYNDPDLSTPTEDIPEFKRPSKTCKSTEFVQIHNKLSELDLGKKKLTIEDFLIGRQLGKGSYAKVNLAKNKITNAVIALKAIEKKFIEKVPF